MVGGVGDIGNGVLSRELALALLSPMLIPFLYCWCIPECPEPVGRMR